MATGYMQPVADDDRVVLLAQLLEGDVAADLDVVVELTPCLATQFTSSSITSRGGRPERR